MPAARLTSGHGARHNLKKRRAGRGLGQRRVGRHPAGAGRRQRAQRRGGGALQNRAEAAAHAGRDRAGAAGARPPAPARPSGRAPCAVGPLTGARSGLGALQHGRRERGPRGAARAGDGAAGGVPGAGGGAAADAAPAGARRRGRPARHAGGGPAPRPLRAARGARAPTRRGAAQDELVAGGHMRPPPDAALAKAGAAKARKAARRGAPAKRAYRAFTSPAGLQARGAPPWVAAPCRRAGRAQAERRGAQVLVGRHPRENDELTRSAADADLWFHARGCPGSHTVLRVPASGCGPCWRGFSTRPRLRRARPSAARAQGRAARGRHLRRQPGRLLLQGAQRGQAGRHRGARQGRQQAARRAARPGRGRQGARRGRPAGGRRGARAAGAGRGRRGRAVAAFQPPREHTH